MRQADEQPLPDVVAITGRVAFWDDLVDVLLAGERRQRPGGAISPALRDEFGIDEALAPFSKVSGGSATSMAVDLSMPSWWFRGILVVDLSVLLGRRAGCGAGAAPASCAGSSSAATSETGAHPQRQRPCRSGAVEVADAA